MSLQADAGGLAEPCPRTHPNAPTRRRAPWSQVGSGGSPLSKPFGYLRKRLPRPGCSDSFAIQPTGAPKPFDFAHHITFAQHQECVLCGTESIAGHKPLDAKPSFKRALPTLTLQRQGWGKDDYLKNLLNHSSTPCRKHRHGYRLCPL